MALAVFASPLRAAVAVVELRPDDSGATPISPAFAPETLNYEPAAKAVIAVLVRHLGLPFPPAKMMVFDDRQEFEQALIEHLKLRPEVAKTTAGFAKAAVSPGYVLISRPAMATISAQDQMVTLAHEMTHLAQSALAGGKGLDRYQWLTEGFAEWAAFRVTHELGVNGLAASRQIMIGQVKPLWKDGKLATLAQMDRFDDWVKVRAARGFNATYPFAFLAVDFLIERHGLSKTLTYFRQFDRNANPALNFTTAFGDTLQGFQIDLNVHLRNLFR